MIVAGLVVALTSVGSLPQLDSPTPTEDRPLEVAGPTCPSLDAVEIERLVSLELRSVTQAVRDGPPLLVTLVCTPSALKIDVTDPLTQKALSRTLPPVPQDVGQERVVALAIAQLFAASWLELLLADAPEPVAPTVEEPPVSTAAKRAAEHLVERKLATRENDLELTAAVGVRGRALERNPFPAAHVDLEVRGWLAPTVGLIARAGFDYGRANRDVGQVQGLDAMLGGGFAWRVRPREAIGVGGAVVLSGGFARLHGRPARDGLPSSTNTSGTGEAVASFGPRIFAARFRLDLDAEVGGMLRAPVGLVERGEEVSMGGVFAGVSLRLGAALPRRSNL